MKEEVSVIITTYKGSNEIENAVLSVLNQTYNNIEIIVVDDNGKGTDDQISTNEALDKYIKKKIIKYIIHNENKNGSAARNTGANVAKGDWLAFLDDDDLYFNKKIEEQLKIAKNSCADMVVCGGFYVDKRGCGYVTRFGNKNKLLLNYLTEKTLFNSSSIFIKRDIFFEMGGFDESFYRHQDWEFCTRVITKKNVVILNKSLYVKYAFGRNIAANAETAENYLEHFFSKIKEILINYDAKTYQKIYNYQVMRVSKVYLKKRDFMNFNRLMKKTSYRLYYIEITKSYLIHFIKKLFLGSKKRCLSYEENVGKLILLRGEIFG